MGARMTATSHKVTPELILHSDYYQLLRTRNDAKI